MSLSREEIQDKILNIIAKQLKVDRSTITLDSSLDSLGADSLDRVEIIIRLEEEFDVNISEDDADKLTTLIKVIDYILSHQK